MNVQDLVAQTFDEGGNFDGLAKVIPIGTKRAAPKLGVLRDATEEHRPAMRALGADDSTIDLLLDIARQIRAQDSESR